MVILYYLIIGAVSPTLFAGMELEMVAGVV